jgi:hypothetical protein
MRKKKPNITKKAAVMAALLVLKRRSRNRSRGSIGCALRRSHQTNSDNAEPAARKAARTGTLVQPSSGPWMIPKIRALSPTSESRAPPGSSGAWVSSRESGAKTHTAAMTARAIGTFTSSVEPHQKPSSRPPVTIGPSEAPAPANPAQMAMALPRSWGGNIAVMIDSVAGMMNAAPTPMRARLAMTCVAPVASPPRRALTANTTSPPMSARFRPKRSPRAPAVSSNPAKRTA